MEVMIYKFIDEGKREHEEMRAFINEFKITNELLFKKRNNSLSELRFEVHELLRVIDNAPTSNYEVERVTTRGGKTTIQVIQNDNTNMHIEEPLVVEERKRRGSAKKFLENLKQLHINLPFIEALAQMPKAAMFTERTKFTPGSTKSLTGTPLKDKSMWSDQEKKIQKIDRLARSLLIQGLPNDICSLIDSNKTAKDLWDALTRHMLGSEYGEQFCKAAVLYEYGTFKDTEGLLLDTYISYLQKKYATMMRQNKNLMDINIDALYNILKQNQEDVNDTMRLKKKSVVVTSDRFDCRENKSHFAKDCKKAKVKDYEYYKTKMLLAKKDKDEHVLLAEDQAWMESSSDSDQEINANMVLMVQIEKFLSDSKASSSSSYDKIAEVSYYTSESESESEYECKTHMKNTINLKFLQV
nr:hypothetical protein [Tanacetum cinerariifolium]